MESRRRPRLLSLLRTRAPQPVPQWGTKHTGGIWEASTGSAWADTRTMAEVQVGRCWCQTTHPSPVVRCGTFSHLLQVLEDAEVVCQVCGQDDVPHEVQHALVVLERVRKGHHGPCRTHPISTPRQTCSFCPAKQTPHNPITFREKWSKMLQPWVLRMAMA